MMQKYDKVLLLGNPGVGKTSLIERVKYNIFPLGHFSTDDTKVHIVSAYGKTYTVCDTAIMDILDINKILVHKTNLMNASYAIIICDASLWISFIDIITWIEFAISSSSNISISIVVNKIDIEIPGWEKMIYHITDKYDNVVRITMCSIKQDNDILRIFNL